MNVSAEAIPFVEGLGNTRGLIEVVTRDFLCRSRWQVCRSGKLFKTEQLVIDCSSQLVCEAAILLSSCVRAPGPVREAG